MELQIIECQTVNNCKTFMRTSGHYVRLYHWEDDGQPLFMRRLLQHWQQAQGRDAPTDGFGPNVSR